MSRRLRATRLARAAEIPGVDDGHVMGVSLEPRIEGPTHGAEALQRRDELLVPAHLQDAARPFPAHLLLGQRHVKHLVKHHDQFINPPELSSAQRGGEGGNPLIH